MEWIAIFLCAGFVISIELLNTAIEYLSDFVMPQQHLQIKKTKDVAAGAVLVAAIVSVVVGGFIFIPHFLHVLK
jgi:diacylglycerol kinase